MAPRAHKRARTFRQGDKAGRKPSLLLLQAEQHSLPSRDSARKYRATTCQPSPLPCIYVRVLFCSVNRTYLKMKHTGYIYRTLHSNGFCQLDTGSNWSLVPAGDSHTAIWQQHSSLPRCGHPNWDQWYGQDGLSITPWTAEEHIHE